MIIEAILIGLFIGILRKGKISRIEYLKINLLPLVFVSLMSVIIIVVMNLGLLEFGSFIYNIFFVLSYALIIIVLVFNLDKKFLFITLIGAVLNFICICFNSFKIPVNTGAFISSYGDEMAKLFLSGDIKFFIPAEGAKLSFLGKLISITEYYFYPVILSIGDIFVALGIILFIQDFMTDKFLQSKDPLSISRSLYKRKRRRR